MAGWCGARRSSLLLIEGIELEAYRDAAAHEGADAHLIEGLHGFCLAPTAVCKSALNIDPCWVKGKSIKEIARALKISRNTVRKVLRSGETAFVYDQSVQPLPKLWHRAVIVRRPWV